jgi:origin recognition complex subunit 5
MSPTSAVKDANSLISAVTAMELPYYAKFLLMAAFLASFNSPKYDRRLFAKHHGMKKKSAIAGRKTVKRSSLIVGPKAFNFERLTAIFHSIADTPYLITTNLCAQVINWNLTFAFSHYHFISWLRW